MSRHRSNDSQGSSSSESYGWSLGETHSHGVSESVAESNTRVVGETTTRGYSYWGDPPPRCCCARHSCHGRCACTSTIVRVAVPAELSLEAHLDAIGAHIAALQTSPRTSRYRMRRLRRMLTRLAERTCAS
jgi:hypothetical protein